MKITSLLALALLTTPLLHAQRYIAEGVDIDQIADSTLFYDSGKGAFFTVVNTTERENLEKIVATNKQGTLGEVLGDLSKYLESTYVDSYNVSFNSLQPFGYKSETYDSMSCWYQAGANMIEYWQNSYGVFADRVDTPSGYTYNKEYVDDLAGALSLDLTAHFYDNLDGKVGSNFGMLAQWYFNGNINLMLPTTTKADGMTDPTGGYYSSHYQHEASYTSNEFNYSSPKVSETMAEVTADITSALGYEMVDGVLTQTKKGQIANIRVAADGYSTGHMVTLYGFELNEKGELKALYIADSDDHLYGITKIYIQQNKDNAHEFVLYTDEEMTTQWGDAGKPPRLLDNVYNINTSSSLNDLYERYHRADTKQVWSGGSSEWGGTNLQDDGGIPTAADGWMRYADAAGTEHDGFYASSYDSTRGVIFNDQKADGATARTVTLAKSMSAPTIEIINDSIAYTFEGNDYSLTAESLVKEGSSSATFRNTTLIVQDVQVREGSFKMDNTQLTGSMSVSSGAELHVTGTESSISGTLTLHEGASLKFSNKSDTLTVNHLVIDNNFQSSETTIGTLIVEGELRVESTADVARMTRLSGIDLLSVTPVTEATLNANLDLRSADALTMSRALSLGGQLMLSSTNKLTLNFAGTPLLDENNYLMLFTDIAGISINGMAADATTDYTQYLELSPEALTSLGEDAALKYDKATGQLYVEVEGVPEPSSSALSLLALAALAARRRRRK